ncbi:hypothetical protein GJ744_005036 [Endocarpon pusillum]|uniref:NACHT domain-containing protein n=1 Tax=Endocarpon pusillum TaxID=364733 RepID=A0A8H7A7H4_9EURO|nr:hypothetical protein GJ744_005036 [Endocarpon pusillum]
MAQQTMDSVNLSQDMSPTQWATILCVLAGAICSYLLFYPSACPKPALSPAEHTLDPTPSAQAGVRLIQVKLDRDDADTDIDIIAIHGLDTTSRDTWTWKSPQDPKNKEKWVNWLHPGMLPECVDWARIFMCDWPAGLLEPPGSVKKTIEEYALLLLEGIQRELFKDGARRQDRPIVFIASCLGGIILTKALVRADDKRSGYYSLRKAARGIVFLATPFRGTSFQDVAAWAEPGLKAQALIQGRGVSKLLDSVKGSSTFDLEELVRQFTQLCQDKHNPCEVFNFYECKTTSLPLKVFPWLPALFRHEKQLVDRASATLDIIPDPLPLDRRHSLTNKFSSPECADYKRVAEKIRQMVRTIRAGTLLEQADAWIRNKHYNTEKLRIERLSGNLLSMDQCYINLAIVEQSGQDAVPSNEGDAKSSPFSLFARQKVETPDKTIQVELPTIFNQRQSRDGGTIRPRRILIQGRAGVGKTTLCKKMVHDFIHHGTWTGLFDRLLWVPLRTLKQRRDGPYNFGKLFRNEYFGQRKDEDGQRLADALWDAALQSSDRTLFILDGLDEVSEEWNRDDDMSRFLETLLDQPNAIITSRPSGILPAGLRPVDLKLETIGFYPDQVKAYLDADPNMKPRANEVQSFLQEHWLIQDLVRIPIQLDALCYTWDDFGHGAEPDTMTGIYQAIEQKLWKKDAIILEKKQDGELVTPFHIGTSDVGELVEDEIYFLQGLAFTGLHNDVIDFTPLHLNAIYRQFKRRSILLRKTLPKLSFLRTSDPASNFEHRNYHFIHLTFQEYFAAQYFVRQWKAKESLQCLELKSKKIHQNQIPPTRFLQKQKYSARYDVFWRFVAGLLDKTGNVEPFIDMIENEPLDLLGPTHQRLVMHCLSEISGDLRLRADIQQRLSKWLLFECWFYHSAEIASEVECPEQALSTLFSEGSDRIDVILRSLSRRATLPPSIIAQVAARLEDKEVLVRQAAVRALSHRSTLSEEILAAVAARLEDKERYVREATVEALGSQSTLPEEILAAVAARLKDNDRTVREVAVDALISRSTLPESILAIMIEQFKDKEWFINWAASKTLSSQSILPEEILTVVVMHLKEQSAQQAAARVLESQLILPEKILAAIAAQLNDKKKDVRWAAITALGSRSILPEDILAAVAVQLKDKEESIQRAAINTLGSRSILPEEILAAVVAQLKDKKEFVREAAVEALGSRSTLPEEILEAIAARLEDEKRYVREAAVKALGRRSTLPEEILAAVAARLKDNEEEVRWAATKALGSRSTLSEETLAAVAAQLEDRTTYVRQTAVRALGSQSTLPEEILVAVAARLEDKQRYVREATVEALRSQSTLPEEILAAVAARLEDEEKRVRWAAEDMLRRHKSFYCSLLSSPHAIFLYKTVLRRSFKEQLSWYIDDSHFCINMPEGIMMIPIDSQHIDVRAIISEGPPSELLSICGSCSELARIIKPCGG